MLVRDRNLNLRCIVDFAGVLAAAVAACRRGCERSKHSAKTYSAQLRVCSPFPTCRSLVAKARYASSLRTHRLKRALAQCFASRLSREYRIVFIFNSVRVVFLDIGTHDDVYR
jgi:mRNA-degrading endonuclease YafQ of YafQ-DinJ toxin-antitoxin module